MEEASPAPPVAEQQQQQPLQPQPAAPALAAKRAAERRFVPKERYMPIKYESDRIALEAADTATTQAMLDAEKARRANNNRDSGPATTTAAGGSDALAVAIVGRRGTIGNTPILPHALKVHPRGFKVLSSSSPFERAMTRYFRLPPQPPARLASEQSKLRGRIAAMIAAGERRQARQLEQAGQEGSGGGGGGLVSTTVTTVIKRANGAEKVHEEVIKGRQLDGFLLLESSRSDAEQLLTRQRGRAAGAAEGGGGDGMPAPPAISTRAIPKSVSERYWAQRDRDDRRQARAERRHEHHLARCARDARNEVLRRGTDDQLTFMTGTSATAHGGDGGGDGDGAASSEISSDTEGSGDDHFDEAEAIYSKGGPGDGARGAATPDDPSHATEADISGRQFIAAVQEDLAFFTNLTFLDAGENRMLLSDLRSLPALEELHLHCNALTQLSDLAEMAAGAEGAEAPPFFAALHSLNLSFNRLPSTELSFIAHLPALAKLDLSNNCLTAIPLEFCVSGAPNLTHLALERNKLRDALGTFAALGCLPMLTEVNLNENQFEALPSMAEMASWLPPPPAASAGGEQEQPPLFPALKVLGLARNRLQFVEDAYPLIQFPLLARVVLWGNPLAAAARDVGLLATELAAAGISDLVLANPQLPKRHAQDFYSTRPPPRAEGQGKATRPSLAAATAAVPAPIHHPEQAQLQEELHRNIQHIFDVTEGGAVGGSGAGAGASHSVQRSGPNGGFLKLPEAVHADYQHIRRIKGQGVAQYNFPALLPSEQHAQRKREAQQRQQQQQQQQSSATQATPADEPTELQRRQQQIRLPGGTMASVARPTAAAEKRAEEARAARAEHAKRASEHEKYSFPSDAPPLFSGKSSRKPAFTSGVNKAAGSGGGGGNVSGIALADDTSMTARQAMAELRRMLGN